MASLDDPEPDGLSDWEAWIDRYISDLPWGIVAYLALALGGLVWAILGHLDHGAYIGAVASGAGLLAVGHGIRTRGRGP